MHQGTTRVIPLLLSIALAGGVYLSFEGFARPRERLVSVREFLVRAGLRGVTPREFVLFSLLAAAVAVLVTQLFLGWGVLSALAGCVGLLAPYAYYIRRHDV